MHTAFHIIKLGILLATIVFYPGEVFAMNMEWEHTLKQTEGSIGGTGEIFIHNGLYYAIISEDTKHKWHVATFDQHGATIKVHYEHVARSRYYKNHDRFISEGPGEIFVYELPSLKEHAVSIRGRGTNQWYQQKNVPHANEPHFVMQEATETETTSLVALNSNGELLWRKLLPDTPFIDILMMTDEFIILASSSRVNDTTSLTFLNMNGDIEKIMHLDAKYEDKIFQSLSGGSFLRIDNDHILLCGTKNTDTYRLAKINIRTHKTQVFSLPSGYSANGQFSILPNDSFVLMDTSMFLLDKDLTPYARFPRENFPAVFVGSFALTPDEDFILGGAIPDPKFAPWIGRFKRSDFVPCDSTAYLPPEEALQKEQEE